MNNGKNHEHEAENEIKKWTVMVYLAGDNNLAEEMVYALKSMYNVGTRKEVAVFAYFDSSLYPVRFRIPTREKRSESLKGTANAPDPNSLIQNDLFGPVAENNELLKFAESLVSHRVDEEPDQVTSVQATLEGFVKGCVCEAQAEHYMLILSGHGTGPVGDFLAANRRATGLSIPDLSVVLRNIEEFFGREGNYNAKGEKRYSKLDILGLDSCQMSSAEVAYQVRKYVNFLVSSEGFQPNTGWPYDQMIASLNRRIIEGGIATIVQDSFKQKGPDPLGTARRKIKRFLSDHFPFSVEITDEQITSYRAVTNKPGITPVELAAGAVTEHVKFYCSDYSLADSSTDLSALSLGDAGENIETVASKLSVLSNYLIQALPIDERSDKNSAMDEIKDAIVLAHWEAQGYKSEQNVDLWDFCDSLQERCGRINRDLATKIASACKDVKDSVHVERVPPAELTEEHAAAHPDQLVVVSGYCGPAFQHSHGISVYFPWTVWTDAAEVRDLDHYKTLAFPLHTQWDEFLDVYLKATQRPPRGRKNAAHRSAINRRPFLYSGRPPGILGRFKIRNGRFELKGQLTFTDTEGQRITVIEGNITIKENRPENYGTLTIRVRDGRVTIQKNGTTKVGTEGTFIVKEAALNVKGGVFRLLNRRLIKTDGAGKTSMLLVERYEVKDGDLTVKDGDLTVKDGDLTVKDGDLTVKGGDFRRSRQAFPVRDADILPVKDGDLTVKQAGDGYFITDDGEPMALVGGDFSFGKDGDLTVKDGDLTVKDGDLTVKDGDLTVKDGDLTVKSALTSLARIESMKNPAVAWNDCGLIEKLRATAKKRDQKLAKAKGAKA